MQNTNLQAGPSSKRGSMPVNLPRPPKRRKTPRACDYCREHKLRCDFAHELTTSDGNPICKHCADFGIECVLTPSSERRRSSVVRLEGSAASPIQASASVLWQTDERELNDARYSGESSLSAIISQFIVMVGGREQNLRTVHRHLTTEGVPPTGYDNYLLLPLVRYPPPAEVGEKKLIQAKLDQDTIRTLFDHYIDFIQPLNAIVSRKELFETIDLSAKEVPIVGFSLLALAVLSVSAMYRDMPKLARAALLFHLRQRRTAIFRTSTETVQTLIVLSQNIELMAPDTNDAAGMSLNLTGLAVRMAHDLGMHRDLSSLGVPPAKVRKMARIWSALIIQDRWYALCYGQPSLVHLDDCDAPEPSLYDDDDEPKKIQAAIHASKRPSNQTHVAHYRIALIAGRLHKIAFGPKGLRPDSHTELKQIMHEIREWTNSLPISLRFNLRSSQPPSVEAGFLFSLRVCLDFLSYRVCLNLPPDHITIDRVDFWSNMVRDSAEALEWLASPIGLRCLDSYSIVMYFMIQCSIVHFYESSRGGSLHSLRVARQSLQNRGTVATQLASRGPVYDPYGPQEPETSEKAGQQKSLNGSHRGGSSGGGKNVKIFNQSSSGRQNPSPSPESGSGPPRLLRLRVKISALISMLLEVAEHRRAAVLAKRDQSNSHHQPHRLTAHQIAEMEGSNGRTARHSNGNSSYDRSKQASTDHPSVSAQSSGPPSPYPVNVLLNPHNRTTSSSHQSPAEHDPSNNRIASPYLAGQTIGTGSAAAQSDSYQSLPPNRNNYNDMANQYPSPNASHQIGMSPRMNGRDRSSSQMGISNQSNESNVRGGGYGRYGGGENSGMMNHHSSASRFQSSGGGNSTIGGKKGMEDHPPSQHAIAIGASLVEGGGRSVHGSVHGSLNDTSSMASLSPKNIEDLDLMTLQRWADALLRNPNSFEQQQQAIFERNSSL